MPNAINDSIPTAIPDTSEMALSEQLDCLPDASAMRFNSAI
ncbi:hypothetical protein [Microbispora bryophytorum]|nr:hypothetical protein [Microbispora camponoti]